MSIHYTCACYLKGHNRVLVPLALELQMVVNCPVDAGNQTMSTGKATSALSLRSISLAPGNYLKQLTIINASTSH